MNYSAAIRPNAVRVTFMPKCFYRAPTNGLQPKACGYYTACIWGIQPIEIKYNKKNLIRVFNPIKRN